MKILQTTEEASEGGVVKESVSISSIDNLRGDLIHVRQSIN